jgi:hypothetical protein
VGEAQYIGPVDANYPPMIIKVATRIISNITYYSEGVNILHQRADSGSNKMVASRMRRVVESLGPSIYT